MKPLRLRARNLRTFPDLDLTFDHGVIGILGELRDAPEGASSNGAGKSTILEAIDIALFGRRSLADYLTEDGPDELMIELTFEHAENLYRVRRTYSAKGRGKTSVDLELSHDVPLHSGDDYGPGWEPLTRASAKETDERLCELIGLSRDTFRDSSYLRQGDGGYADPNRDPRQRKELLVEAVLGHDPVWPRLLEQPKARRRTGEQQLERHRGETERLTETASGDETVRAALAAAETQVVTTQKAVCEAEEAHSAATTRWQAAREQSAARATIEAELKNARTELVRLEQLETAAAEAVLTSSTFRDELATLSTPAQMGELEARERELVAQLDAFTEARRAREAAQRDRDAAVRRKNEILERARQKDALVADLGEKAVALKQQEQPLCQTCGQEVDGGARQRAIKSYLDDADLHRAAAAREREEADKIALPEVPDAPAPPTATLGSSTLPAREVLADVEAQIARARQHVAQRARLEERLTQLNRESLARPSLDTITAARDAVHIKERVLDELEPVDLDTLTREGTEALARLDQARTAHTAAVTEKTRWEERLATVTAAKEKLAEISAAIRDLQAQVDRDVLLERAYGRDGIPALIIENTAIPSIEAEASRILRALGTSLDIQLRTQAETKSGGLKDTLDVVVIGATGSERSYSTYSGGEQTRIRLALQIALARLLANRRGAESRLLALDEPSYLDAAGMTALLEVLRGLDGEFDLILLVSHVAELRDALDETITVIKEHGISRLAGAHVLEEVAA